MPLFASTSDYNTFGQCDVRNVEGFNPQGFGTGVLRPSVPASGTAQGNPNPFPCLVTVEGGAVSEIEVGGVSTGLTSGTFLVPASDGTITLTYTTAPTWSWQGI